jgi:glucokinase
MYPMKENIVIGIDVGGTHLTIAPVDLKKREVLLEFTKRLDFDSNGNPAEILENWSNLIQSVISDCSIDNVRIGIAFPAPFDFEKGICYIQNQNKFHHFFDLNIKIILARRLNIPGSNIRFFNDAACFLKGEIFCNDLHPANFPLGLTLGTGLGSSKVINGSIVDAEYWNMPFKDGIVEDYLSTRWFLNSYYSLTGEMICSVKEIASLASGLDLNKSIICKNIFNEFGYNLAEFIIEIYPEVKPDILYLGGNISKAYHLFNESFFEKITEKAYEVNLKVSTLGEQAIIIGAASLCRETHLNNF